MKNMDYEKREKQLDAEKNIRRPHGIIYNIENLLRKDM